MIHIINRHCNFSSLSVGKKRPKYFSREACFVNLHNTAYDINNIKYHYLLDGDPTDHFIAKYNKNIVRLYSGTGAKSFLDAVDYVTDLKLPADDIVYFVEDDYLHNYGWDLALLEGIGISDNCWISLYDHGDKYFDRLPESIRSQYTMYKNYVSKVTYTQNNFWRSACSTTDTFALLYKNLIKYKNTITMWSKIADHSLDHNRGLALNEAGFILWTPMPGYSTHMEPDYMSPIIDWEFVQKNTFCNE